MKMELDYEKMELDNQLRVATRWINIPDVAVVTRVNQGGMHDPPGKYGINHLMEHLFFRGGDGEDVKTELARITGRDLPHAVTRPEDMVFDNRMPFEDLELFLYTWGDAVRRTEYEAHGFDTERNIVLEEIGPAGREGTAGHHFAQLFRDHIFPGSRLGQSAGGTTKDVRSLTPEDVRRHKAGRVHAQNTYLTIVGGYDKSRLQGWLDGAFGELSRGSKSDIRLSEVPDIEPIENRFSFQGFPHNQLYMFYQAPGQVEDHYLTMQILREYLAGGANSQLFQRLREREGLVYEVGTNSFEPEELCFVNRNPWYIGASRFDEDHYDRVVGGIKEEIDRVRQGDIDENALQLAQLGYKKTFYQHHLQSPVSQALRIDEYTGRDLPYNLEGEIAAWRDVLPSDLQRTAQHVFNNKYATVWISPGS